MSTVRYSEAYAGPSRTKDLDCSQRVWFFSMITLVNIFPASHTRNWPSSRRSTLSIHSTARTGHPMIIKYFVPEKTSKREALHLGRRIQEHCEGLGLVTATGILGTRKPSVR
ncbi:hypothetical protein TNCV_1039321 [Trichonephila clavipes]|uniref:Uncharacterized protein n=1 Tax=Trichonephila clavipes TaxID=2585209 RepID=A0A8X6VW43_TRICX|nr:hypothetical protein TNCV_1039321 [Trichonephila clavipes]